MVRRHTTGPVQPIGPTAPVRPISLHRLSGLGRVSFDKARAFYRAKLRRLARDKPDAPPPR